MISRENVLGDRGERKHRVGGLRQKEGGIVEVRGIELAREIG